VYARPLPPKARIRKKDLAPVGEKQKNICANFQNENICADPPKLTQLGEREPVL